MELVNAVLCCRIVTLQSLCGMPYVTLSAISMLCSILVQPLLERLAAQPYAGGNQQAAHTQALDLHQQNIINPRRSGGGEGM